VALIVINFGLQYDVITPKFFASESRKAAGGRPSATRPP
jgi:hypothetical protein